jgi:hypothetical protein
VELVKGFHDRLAQHVVHCESFSRPIDATTKRAELRCNPVAIVPLPLPHFFNKLFATKVMTIDSLILHEHLFHHGLGGNAGMIRAYENVKSKKQG